MERAQTFARALAAALLLASLTPCEQPAQPIAALGHAHSSAHAIHGAAAPCHEAAASAVRAPCPCGCERGAPAAKAAGSALVGVLAEALAVPDASPAREALREERATPEAPLRAIEKVPRAA